MLGLLERRSGNDPESALLDLAADLALQGRPLLLLIDDAASLPEETARGLADLLARAQGALRMVLAGIDSAELLRASAAFGDAVMRVALHEGIVDERLREYVTAQLELVHAPRSLREVFDDAALAELGRVAEGNPRRLHIAAQSIARRAGTPLDVVMATAAAHPPETAATDPPREPAPEPTAVSPVAEVAAPAGEYRYVRGKPVAESEDEAPVSAPAEPPRDVRLPPAEVDWTLAAMSQPVEPTPTPPSAPAPGASLPPVSRPAFDPPWVDPTKLRSPKPVAPARGRSPSVVAVALVAAASAVIGFALASGFTRDRGGLSALIDRLTTDVDDVMPETVRDVAPEPSAEAPPSFPAAGVAPDERIDVSINASPWANVEIDGEPVGETPLGGVPLSPGSHHFRLRFPDGSVREREIQVDAEHRAIVFE